MQIMVLRIFVWEISHSEWQEKMWILYGHCLSSLLLEYAVRKVQINQKQTLWHPALTLLRKHVVWLKIQKIYKELLTRVCITPSLTRKGIWNEGDTPAFRLTYWAKICILWRQAAVRGSMSTQKKDRRWTGQGFLKFIEAPRHEDVWRSRSRDPWVNIGMNGVSLTPRPLHLHSLYP